MKIRIKKSDLSLFLRLELFMLPAGLMSNSIFSYVWYGLLSISIGIFLLKIFRQRVQRKFSIIIWLTILYLGLQACATAVNGSNWIYNLMTLMTVIFLLWFVEENLKVDYIKTMTCLKNVLLFNILLEIFVYLFMSFSVLDSIQASFVYYGIWGCMTMVLRKNRSQWNYSLTFVSLLFILVTIVRPDIGVNGEKNYEGTFYVMVFVLLFFDFAVNVKAYVIKWFNGIVAFASIIALNLIFVFLQIQAQIPGIRFLFEDILHKDITITGRSGIWSFALGLWYKSPKWGYGTGLVGMQESGGWYDFIRIYGPHNQFLYMLLSGGIITFSAYILLVFYVSIKLYKNRKDKMYIIFSIGFFVTYLELLMTYRTIATCMPLFAFFAIVTSSYTQKHTLMMKNFSKSQ